MVLFGLVGIFVYAGFPWLLSHLSDNQLDPYYYIPSYVIAAVQVSFFIRWMVPDYIKKRKGFSWILSYRILLSERNIKQAVVFKTNRMVRNALACHTDGPIDTNASPYYFIKSSMQQLKNNDRSASAEAMVRHHKEHLREKLGGPIWVFRNLLNKNLLKNEGIWISNARLLYCNIAQWIVFIIFVTLGISGQFIFFGTNLDVFSPSPSERKWVCKLLFLTQNFRGAELRLPDAVPHIYPLIGLCFIRDLL